mgnify:FL=1
MGKKQPSLFFDQWAEGNEIKDLNNDAQTLYHGTFGNFKKFDPSMNNPESYVGSAIYTTNSENDLNRNYSDKTSPDFAHRFEKMKDDLYDLYSFDEIEFVDKYGDYQKEFGEINDENIEYFINGVVDKVFDSPRMMPLYGKMKNPFMLEPHQNPKYFYNYNYEEDEETGDVTETEEGNWLEIKDIIYNVLSNWLDESEINDVLAKIENIDQLESGITPLELFDKLTAELDRFQYEIDGFYSRNVIQEIIQDMGHDGIIMDAHHFFPYLNYEGDRHYVFFDPNQVKSAIGNSGLYDVNDADVTANNNHKNKKYSQYGQLAIPKIHIPEEYRNNFIKKHKELVRNTSDKHSIEYNPIPTASYWIIHPNGDIDLLKENHKPHMERVMDYISKNNNQLNEQPEDLIKSSAHEKIHHIFQGGIRVYAFIADTKSLVYITMFQIPTEQQKTAIHALFTEIDKRSVYITISADFEIFNNNTTTRINKNFVSIQAFESFVDNLDRQIEKEPVATSEDIRNEPEFEFQEQIQEKPAIEYDKSKMKSVLESMPIKQPQSLKYTGAKRLFKRTTV